MWLVSQEERRAFVICPLLSSWKYQEYLALKTNPSSGPKSSVQICYIFIQGSNWPGNDYKTHILNKRGRFMVHFRIWVISPCLPQARSPYSLTYPQLVHSVGTELLPSGPVPVKDVMGIVLLHLTVSKWIANSFWTEMGAGFFLGKQKRKVRSFHTYLWSVGTWQIIFLGISLSLMPQGEKNGFTQKE